MLDKFLEWCRRSASEETCRRYIRYLEGCDPWVSTNRWCRTAWKKYLRWRCELLEDQEACKAYRHLRVPRSGVDLRVPSIEEVVEGYRRIRVPVYRTVYLLLLESGLRLSDLLSTSHRCQRLDGFVRCLVAKLKSTKRAFWAYLLEPPPQDLGGIVKPEAYRAYVYKVGAPGPRQLRKFVATQMLRLGIPRDVINFIQGRVPQDILSAHYLDLLVLADQYYPRYAQWLRTTVMTKW